VSKEVANDLLNFMRQKRLEIEKRKTESELLDLKDEILLTEISIQSSTSSLSATEDDVILSVDEDKKEEENVIQEGAEMISVEQEDVIDEDMEVSQPELVRKETEEMNSYLAASPAV